MPSRSPGAVPHTLPRAAPRPPFECIALVLQGGGAMGAYQGGVYEALAEADLHPDWVAGISIGAINSAIIAGNPPADRLAKLRAFWEGVTASPFSGLLGTLASGNSAAAAMTGDAVHGMLDQISAGQAMFGGVPGFFAPRFPPPWLSPPGSPAATSFYDTAGLKTTLERFVDFNLINQASTRLSVGAVNVRSGNFVYFDTATDRIGPEHVMASGALPPGFPAIEIDGEHYWDGGLVSNTPLQWIVDAQPRRDTLAFQVDLWSARGDFPRDLAGVAVRGKEIQFSSRTRASTDRLAHMQKIRAALSRLLAKLPPDLQETPECEELTRFTDHTVYNVVQLIYRSKYYEGNTKDYEFSRTSMEDHWNAGYTDAVRTLRHREIFERPDKLDGYFSFDFNG